MKKKVAMIKKGEIHLVPFPFTDLSGSKLRPCVVLACDQEDIKVVFVTSCKPKSGRSIEVLPSATNGIKVFSYIRYTKLATIDRKMSLGSIGDLEEKIYRAVVRDVCDFLS